MPAPSSSKRPMRNPRSTANAAGRGNRAAELEASEYNDVLRNGGRNKTERKAKGGKTTRRRPDAETTRGMQQRTNERMSNALRQSAAASGGVREGMGYGRYPGTAGDRMQSERENADRRKSGGKVKKMAGGGMCRGMGAATRGGKYRSS